MGFIISSTSFNLAFNSNFCVYRNLHLWQIIRRRHIFRGLSKVSNILKLFTINLVIFNSFNLEEPGNISYFQWILCFCIRVVSRLSSLLPCIPVDVFLLFSMTVVFFLLLRYFLFFLVVLFDIKKLRPFSMMMKQNCVLEVSIKASIEVIRD